MDRNINGGICSDETWTDGGIVKYGKTGIEGRDMDTGERMEDCGEEEMKQGTQEKMDGGIE